jgi:hypothetical protein
LNALAKIAGVLRERFSKNELSKIRDIWVMVEANGQRETRQRQAVFERTPEQVVIEMRRDPEIPRTNSGFTYQYMTQ